MISFDFFVRALFGFCGFAFSRENLHRGNENTLVVQRSEAQKH